MIPRNNQEKFIEKFGHLWYLRDFDFLPEPLELYMHNLKYSYINECLMMHVGKIFITKEEAIEASRKIRNQLGLVKFRYNDGKEI